MATKRGLQTVPPPGSIVRLTGYFLRATGQAVGEEGTKRWPVLAPGECGFPSCGMCVRGTHAVIIEEISAPHVGNYGDAIRYEGYEDIVSTRVDGALLRHVALANLELVGAPPRAVDQADEVGPVATKHIRKGGRRPR